MSKMDGIWTTSGFEAFRRAKFTTSSDKEWMAVGRVGFKGGRLNTIAVEVNGEIPIGPVVFTQIKFGVTGMAETVQTYSPGLGVAFGPEINFGSLVSPVAKVLGLKVGNFHVVEVGVSGDVSSDFNEVNLSVEGKLLGLLEIKGGWKRKDGNYNEISLSVGTKSAATFNFCISGSVGWSSDQLTVKGMLDGSFKWDFTALGITWVGVNVGGGISVVYNQSFARKTLSVAVNGRANVKVAFVKFGVDVGKSWFFDLSSNRGYDCVNAELGEAERPAFVGGRVPLRDGAGGDVPEGDRLASHSWTASALAASGKMYITVAAQYSLSDLEWVLYSADGRSYASADGDGPVEVTRVSYSQLELAVEKPAEGVWTLDVYGSAKWNGEVLIYAEAGDPIETDVRVVAADKNTVTVEYQAHATGENSLVALYMERADKADDEYEGTILDYLQATAEGEYRQAVVNLPEDVQGGQYRFYVMAQSTNAAEIAYSAKTEAVEIVRRTAAFQVTDYRVELQAEAPGQGRAVFTVANLGSEDAGDFAVDLLLGDSELNVADDIVLATTVISLQAGASRQVELAFEVPEAWRGELAVLSVRLDGGNAVDEGIFEDGNTAMKTLSFASDEGNGALKSLQWHAVAGAASYTLEYASERNWENDVAVSGIVGTSLRLGLAPGSYSFRVTPYDEAGEAIEAGIQAWDDRVCFTDGYSLSLGAGERTATTEVFALLDGFYDLCDVDLGKFTGKLMLYQVDGKKEGVDAKKMTVQVTNGKVKTNARQTTDLLLDNGLYYFTASRLKGKAKSASGLSFSLSGDLFLNDEAERGVLSLPDSVDEAGHFGETLSGWVGAFEGRDKWEFLLEEAGELSLAVRDVGRLTDKVTVDLYVQNATDGNYAKAQSFTLAPGMKKTSLLADYLVTNNFYLEVSAPDNGKGKYNSEYALDLGFQTFDDTPLEDDEFMLDGGAVTVQGWVGYGNEEETYLLQIDDEDAGAYKFTLSGEAKEAYLKIYSVSGKRLKGAMLNKKGKVTFSDVSLYAGDYLVSVVARQNAKTTYNTDYTLKIKKSVGYEIISEGKPVEVAKAARREKLVFAVDALEDATYDASELVAAGLTVKFYEATPTGKPVSLPFKSGQVDLLGDDLCYMEVSNCRAAWGGDGIAIGLDEERHKFLYGASLAARG